MTNEQINIAIAEACGYEKHEKFHRWRDPQTKESLCWKSLPDCCSDLNAMHEAESYKDMYYTQRWVEIIVGIALRESVMDFEHTDGWDWVLLVSRLNASQRAEAFLKTIGKWEGGTQ